MRRPTGANPPTTDSSWLHRLKERKAIFTTAVALVFCSVILVDGLLWAGRGVRFVCGRIPVDWREPLPCPSVPKPETGVKTLPRARQDEARPTAAEIERDIEKARRETLEKALKDVASARATAPAPLPSVPKLSPARPGFVAEGWTAAGVYSDGVWSSKLLSFPATSRPEDLSGLIVATARWRYHVLRDGPPRSAGDLGKEIGEVNVGDQLEIGEVYTVPTTTAGVSVWVAVRRAVR